MTPYYQDQAVTIYHGDCREILPQIQPVDLVLTDPPYGIGRDGVKESVSARKHGGRKGYEFQGWDDKIPEKEVFALLFSMSLNQIIWGGNYFCEYLPPRMGWIFWDKGQRISTSDGELAFTSYDTALRVITLNRVEILIDGAIHPTQKPMKLMTYCIQHADKHAPAKSILDPFMGSGTTLRAAKDMGRIAVGVERSEKFCELAARRMSQEVLAL